MTTLNKTLASWMFFSTGKEKKSNTILLEVLKCSQRVLSALLWMRMDEDQLSGTGGRKRTSQRGRPPSFAGRQTFPSFNFHWWLSVYVMVKRNIYSFEGKKTSFSSCSTLFSINSRNKNNLLARTSHPLPTRKLFFPVFVKKTAPSKIQKRTLIINTRHLETTFLRALLKFRFPPPQLPLYTWNLKRQGKRWGHWHNGSLFFFLDLTLLHLV